MRPSILLGLLTLAIPATAGEPVIARRLDDGVLPRVAVRDGVVHMIYCEGDAKGGDVLHVRRPLAGGEWSKPVRVNSQPGSVVWVGTVRGPRLAVGRGGRAHVLWMGSQKAAPRAPGEQTPLLYARSKDGGGFEPQRNLIQAVVGLDGGGTIAADRDGNVYAIWHGKGARDGEADRIVAVARSTDDGKTWAREMPALRGRLGACACCGIEAATGPRGQLAILYRSATGGRQRDTWLLRSTDGGRRFKGRKIGPWTIAGCMMSTSDLTLGAKRELFAWETKGQIYLGLGPPGKGPTAVVPAPGAGDKRKHPAVARTPDGRTLLVWTEGTGWNKGGSVVWQLYDAKGRPAVKGRRDDLPAWSRPAVYARPDGTFVIQY